jgi:hypothetical protein
LLGEAHGLRAKLLALGFERSEGAVRLRDGALGFAQRVAGFAALGFLGVELFLDRGDAAAERFQVLLARCRVRGERRAGKRERDRADQTLALPCAETAAMRLAISSWSPR